jgi:hypothetical protein
MGVGWNNTSGALNYLVEKQVVKFEEVEELYPCTRLLINDNVEVIEKKMYPVVNTIVDRACEFIHNNPGVIKEKNTEDMWNYDEADAVACEGSGCECTSLDCDQNRYTQSKQRCGRNNRVKYRSCTEFKRGDIYRDMSDRHASQT